MEKTPQAVRDSGWPLLQELVDRAFEVSKLAFARLEAEGHLVEMPALVDRLFLKDGFEHFTLAPVKTAEMLKHEREGRLAKTIEKEKV